MTRMRGPGSWRRSCWRSSGWRGLRPRRCRGRRREASGRRTGATWRTSHYSPLDQINAAQLQPAGGRLAFQDRHFGTRPEFKLEGTPIVVGGVAYATAGTRRSVIALDAGTGELLWSHAEFEGARAATSPRQLSGRGVAYWTDGRDERILYVTTGYQLVALDAKTGARIASFGSDGIIDLKTFAVFGNNQPIDLVNGEIGVHSTPTVTTGGVVLVGSSFREGGTPKTHNNTKGMVLAFDVRTGKKLWQFNTIPRPGEFGNDTWLNDSWAVNGNTGVWNQMAVDEELGLAYLPVETPSSDFYGGHRPGQQPVRGDARRRRSQDRQAANGTSSSCTIRSGTWTSRPRRSSRTSSSTAGR